MNLALKDALLEWNSLSLYTQPTDFVFLSHRCTGRKPLDLAAVLKRKIRPAFESNLKATNKYLQATPNSKRLTQEKLVDAIFACWGVGGEKINPNPIRASIWIDSCRGS